MSASGRMPPAASNCHSVHACSMTVSHRYICRTSRIPPKGIATARDTARARQFSKRPHPLPSMSLASDRRHLGAVRALRKVVTRGRPSVVLTSECFVCIRRRCELISATSCCTKSAWTICSRQGSWYVSTDTHPGRKRTAARFIAARSLGLRKVINPVSSEVSRVKALAHSGWLFPQSHHERLQAHPASADVSSALKCPCSSTWRCLPVAWPLCKAQKPWLDPFELSQSSSPPAPIRSHADAPVCGGTFGGTAPC